MSSYEDRRAKIKLRRLLSSTESSIKPAMRDVANILEREMRARVPRDTGNLAEVISSFVAKNGTRAEVGFRGKKGRAAGFYARFIEFGTKGHKATADLAKVLSGGGETYGTTADIPAMHARPFIGPTWENKKPEVISRVSKAISDTIKRVQAS